MLKKRTRFITLLLCITLSTTAVTHAAAISLPKTGQTSVYSTGDDGSSQKGVAEPAPRFTNANGTTPVSGSVVVDQLTGLMWTQNGAPGGALTWQAALDYIAGLNASSYLGYSDWRLPNRDELTSLVNYGQSNTASWLNTQGFTNAQASIYWSSTTYAGYTGYAWYVDMSGGGVYYDYKTDSYYVWPVRAGQSGSFGSLTISPSSPDFGSVLPGDSGDLTISLTNQGSSTITLGTLAIQDSSAFSITLDSCTNGQLAPNAVCSVTVRFTPQAVQAYTGALSIPYGGSSTTVTLKGSGSGSGAPSAFFTLYETQGGAPNSSYLGSVNGDNDFAGTSEMAYATSGEDASIISHVLYPVEYYTQKTSDRSGFLSARAGVSDPDSTDTRQPLVLIHGWQGDSSVTSGFIDRDQRWLLEDSQLGESYWNNFIQYFNNTPELNLRYRLYVYHYPSYKHISFNARVLAQLIPRVGYINNWLAAGKQVTILAHSMGGLVARSLLEEHDGEVTVTKGDGSAAVIASADLLGKLITTATPHHGSPASVYWWLKKEGYTSQLADFVKDLFSPGAQDLFWDNYDGVFDWAVGSSFNYIEGGTDVNRIDFANSGRRAENASFDSYYRTKLHLLDSKANDAYTTTLTINSQQTTVYRYPNPWLSWMNARFKQNNAAYTAKYIFFGGYNDGDTASQDDRLNDAYISDLAADARVYEMGYINDWVVPMTSSYLDFSKESTGELLSYNAKLFSDSGGKSALFPSWLTDHTKVELNSSVNGVPVRALKDYNHDRMANGAYYSAADDLLAYASPSGFNSEAAMQLYLEQSGVSWSAYQAASSDPALQADAKLLYEPLFNLFKTDLVSEAVVGQVFVTPQAGAGGSISPATSIAINSGETAQFTITPNSDYLIASVTGCDGTLSGNTYTTGPVTADCTVFAQFNIDMSKCVRQMGDIIIRSSSCSSVTAYNVFSGLITMAHSSLPDNPLLKIDSGSLNLDNSIDRINSPVGSSSSLYVPGVYGYGDLPLGWGFNFEVSAATMKTPLDSSNIVLEGAQKITDALLGFSFALDSMTLSPYAVSIEGTASSSFFSNKYFTDSEDKPVSLAAGVTLSQTDGVSVDSLALSVTEIKCPGLTIEDASVKIDTDKQRYELGGQVSLKNIFNGAGIGGSLAFTNTFPYIDEFSLKGSHINKPFGHPLVFLQEVEGSVSGIVAPPLIAALKASFSGGPELPSELAGFEALCANNLGLEFNASSSLAGTGGFGALCASEWESYKNGAIGLTGKLEYNWKKNSFDSEADAITIADMFDGSGTFHWGSGTDISGKAVGTLKLPVGIPGDVGGLPLANHKLSFDNKGYTTSTAIWGYETVLKVDWALFTDAWYNAWKHVAFGTNYEELSNASFQAQSLAHGKKLLFSAGPSGVTVPAGLDVVIIKTKWQSGSSEVSLVAPDGTALTADYVAAHPDTVIYSLLATEAWYMIKSPAAGLWGVVIADPEAIGDYTVSVNTLIAKPSISIASPSSKVLATSTVDIAYTASGAAGSPNVALYFDTKNSGETGIKIVDGLPVSAGTYNWDVSAMQPGVYYVYARIDDGMNVPVVAYAAGSIEITNDTAPPTPADFSALVSGTTISTSWSAVSGAAGYKIYYTDASNGETYQSSVSLATGATSYALVNLKPATAYRLTIASYYENLSESVMASPVTVSTADAPTPVIGVSTGKMDFGVVQNGQTTSMSLALSNSGTAELVVSSVDFSGSNSPLLALDPGVSLPLTIKSGETTTVTVNLNAATSGTVNSLMLLGSNDPATPKKSVVMAATVPYLSFTVTFTAGANGVLSGESSQSVTNSGNSTPVTAIANTGYHFDNWTGTNGFVTTTTNPLTVDNVTASQAITANFAVDLINGACGGSNGGTFTVAPSTNLCSTGNASAVTGSGPWSWACGGSNGGTDASCSANIQTYIITFQSNGNGSLSGTTSQTVNHGASTTDVTAHPASGYHFVNWTGTNGFAASTANPLIVTNVTSSMTITANFAIDSSNAPDGDLDLSGTVDVSDALLALRISSGLVTPDATELSRGDVAPLVNNVPQPDGAIDIGDVVVILRKAVGLAVW